MIDTNPVTPRRSARTRWRIPASILLTASIAGALALYVMRAAAAPKATHTPSPAATVTATNAVEERWPVSLDASGAIAPWQEAIIGAQVAGVRLTEMRVSVGDRIKRGQVLARFESETLKTDEARLDALWQQAEANRQRAFQLKGSGGISDQDLLQYATQAQVAKAQLQAVQLQLRYTDVLAPDDGVVSARSATLGAVSAVGQELFRIIRQERLEWRGELTAVQLAQIKPGQRVRLALPDGSIATAKVRQIAPALDAQSRLGTVFADLETGSRARAGMYAQGNVELAQSAAVVVPASSLVVRDGRSYVIVLTGTNKASERRVDAGRRRDEAVEIIGGLRSGERVVVRGAGFLYEGDTVRVAPAAAASAASKEGT
jgi:RND family efflux transporter MFP subunit